MSRNHVTTAGSQDDRAKSRRRDINRQNVKSEEKSPRSCHCRQSREKQVEVA